MKLHFQLQPPDMLYKLCITKMAYQNGYKKGFEEIDFEGVKIVGKYVSNWKMSQESNENVYIFYFNRYEQ